MAGFFIGNKWDVYNGFPSCIIAPFYSLSYGTRSSCSDFFNCFDLSTVPTVNTFWICIYLKTESRIFLKKKNKTPVRNFAINVVWGPKWKPQRIVFRSFERKKIVCDTLLMKCQVPTQVSLKVETLNLLM